MGKYNIVVRLAVPFGESMSILTYSLVVTRIFIVRRIVTGILSCELGVALMEEVPRVANMLT